MKSMFRFLVLALYSLLQLGCAGSPDVTSGRVVVHDDRGLVDIVFSDHDRRVIHDYFYGPYRPSHKGIPPGLARKGDLPPGLQKQLVRRGKLPPGLQYRLLPAELERRLSYLPDGYLRAIVGGNLVLFDRDTRVIFDVVHDW